MEGRGGSVEGRGMKEGSGGEGRRGGRGGEDVCNCHPHTLFGYIHVHL